MMKCKAWMVVAAVPWLLVACAADEPEKLLEAVDSDAVVAVGETGLMVSKGDTISLRGMLDATTRTGSNVQDNYFRQGNKVTLWMENYLVEDDDGNEIVVDGPTEITCTVGADEMTLYHSKGLLMYPKTGDLTVTATAPKTTGNYFTVAADQCEEDGYLASDLVLSPRTAYTQKAGTLELQFSHLLTKIVVKLTAASGSTITATELAAATVEVRCWRTCRFDRGAQTSVAATDIVYTAKERVSMSVNGACIIPPQVYQPGETFIIITTAKGNKKVYIPTPNGKTFEGGKEYVYNLTVNDGWEMETNVWVADWGQEESVGGVRKVVTLENLKKKAASGVDCSDYIGYFVDADGVITTKADSKSIGMIMYVASGSEVVETGTDYTVLVSSLGAISYNGSKDIRWESKTEEFYTAENDPNVTSVSGYNSESALNGLAITNAMVTEPTTFTAGYAARSYDMEIRIAGASDWFLPSIRQVVLMGMADLSWSSALSGMEAPIRSGSGMDKLNEKGYMKTGFYWTCTSVNSIFVGTAWVYSIDENGLFGNAYKNTGRYVTPVFAY